MFCGCVIVVCCCLLLRCVCDVVGLYFLVAHLFSFVWGLWCCSVLMKGWWFGFLGLCSCVVSCLLGLSGAFGTLWYNLWSWLVSVPKGLWHWPSWEVVELWSWWSRVMLRCVLWCILCVVDWGLGYHSVAWWGGDMELLVSCVWSRGQVVLRGLCVRELLVSWTGLSLEIPSWATLWDVLACCLVLQLVCFCVWCVVVLGYRWGVLDTVRLLVRSMGLHRFAWKVHLSIHNLVHFEAKRRILNPKGVKTGQTKNWAAFPA